MQDFDYVAAKTVDEVVGLLSAEDGPARILSGGTDLIVQLREGRKTAQRVVDIKRIPEVNALVFEPGHGLTIGASVSCMRLCQDRAAAAAYPGLVDAVSLIGGTQIQGRASVGGNLCNASPAADSIPALIAHRAVLQIAGPGGVRELPVEQMCIGPGRNALGPGEFLVSIRLPQPPPRFGARYLRFIPRNEMDIAVVGVGVSVVLAPDLTTIEDARVALGAVGPTPILAEEAGAVLRGKPASPESILEAARAAQAAARPITDMRGTAEQRRHLVMILTRRALEGALERARGANYGGAMNGGAMIGGGGSHHHS